MKPELCTSDFIYFIEDDALLDNRGSGRRPITPVDGHDLAHQRVNGWQRVMVSQGSDLNPTGARRSRQMYEEDSWYIVAMPTSGGNFPRPYGDPEFEYEALISF